MLSSIANRLYWVARNLERVEQTARLVVVFNDLLLDLPKEADVSWHNLVRITGGEEGFAQERQWPLANAAMHYLAAQEKNSSSIISCIRVARENMRTLRDAVPREAFESVNDLYHFANQKLSGGTLKRVRYSVLTEIMERCQQVYGLFAATMSRGIEYDFLMLGRYLERADMSTRVLDIAGELLTGRSHTDSTVDEHATILWISVLRSASAYQMYRQSVRSRVTPVRVVHFLINDEQFPRSVRFCLRSVADAMRRMPRNEAPLHVIETLLHDMDQMTLREVAGADLNKYLDEFQERFAGVHASIEQTWFEPYDVVVEA